MSIKITRPGVLATLQDMGRRGYRHIGVGSAGAMDGFAPRVANYLCGNDENKAVIEMNFPAPEILFETDALISITGADFSAQINENKAPIWRTMFVKKGNVLNFARPVYGSRAYLAVAGGWEAQQWLGSQSTHLKLHIGGHAGRALQKDDGLMFPALHFALAARKVFPWSVSRIELDKVYLPANTIRCTAAPEYSELTQESKRNLEQQIFTITKQSDRMGYRLNADPLDRTAEVELVSSAVDSGTVQLLPDGNCTILMVDHQTTGGYPRIASVIKADIPKLAQAKPGDRLNFSIVSLAAAENHFIHITESLLEIKAACALHIENILSP